MTHIAKETFTVRELCARYGICRATFYAEVKRGRLRAIKLGKKTIVMRADADAWAASLPELRAGGRAQASA